MTSPVTDQNKTAYDMMLDMLRGWGLEELAPDVSTFLQQGYTQDQVSFYLQQTDSYKRRFIGNEARRKAGLPVLSPKEYLATEASYRQIMQAAGLPIGFYDQPSDFADFLGKDISPTEVNSRVSEAMDVANRVNPYLQQYLTEQYGMGANVNAADIAAWYLDPERSDTYLKKAAGAMQIGGLERQYGLNVDRSRAEYLAGATDVTGANLAQATAQTATWAGDIGKLSRIYGGQQYGQTEAENEAFLSDEEAKRRRQKLTEREQGSFAGTGGVGKSSLSRPTGSY